MKIEYINADVLKKYNNNAKEHPDEQVNEIAKSIERFGFRQPIVVDRNYVIVIGHGRLMAAKKLGIKQVPVTIIDDLTDDEINALRLVDNRLNESTWDFSALEAELATITGIDMSDFGFEPITEEEIEYTTRRSEMAPETPWGHDEEEYTESPSNGEYGGATRPYTQVTPLQATNRDKANDDVEARGGRLIGERSLIEANGGMEYRYTCPRCKHRFN